MFDHDKGQKSAISGRRLHWRLSTGFFCFFSSIYVRFSETSPLKSGESSEKSSGENRVKSCHVCGCHGFFSALKTLESFQNTTFMRVMLLKRTVNKIIAGSWAANVRHPVRKEKPSLPLTLANNHII